MNPDNDRILRVLEEIRDDQRRLLEQQREQLAVVQRQAERTERIQARAEDLQERSAAVVGMARKVLVVVLPIIIGLIGYLTWLLFR
jgi:hypothetical protein